MLFSCSLLRLPDWQRGFTTMKSFALLSLLFVLVCPTARAAEPYTLAQIQAEGLELMAANFEDRETRLKEMDRRIIIAKGDSPRIAALYLQKALINKFRGSLAIEDNLAKAMPLIDKDQHPELYLFAMTIKAYGLYTYQNRAAEAVELLEQIQQHPAIKNDIVVQVKSLSSLLEVYYQLKRYDKISKPLFQLVKILSAKDIDPVYQNQLYEIDEELAYHSALIGDVEQAIALHKKVSIRAASNNEPVNIAIQNCNIANLYFLPIPEKFQYAKASLKAMNNIGCSDAMQKLVLLEEVQQGNLNNIARLAEFNPAQQLPILNERSAYYAGLAYLHLNDLIAVQKMMDRMTDPDNWARYDLLQQLAAKQGDYEVAFAASQKYHQLRAQKDADARTLMLASYQTRLELAQEDTKAAEQARQAEKLAAAEQKADARLQLIFTVIGAGLLVTLILSLYLVRSRQLQQRLQLLSDTDPLTGLLNRRAFLRQAEQLKQLAQRQQFPLAIALLDLDFFKKINDQYGHQVGDAVLRAFADAATTTLRQTDVIGRFGGEEFILATTEQNTTTFAALLQRLQQCFSQMCLADRSIGFSVSFSAGIANITQQNAAAMQEIEQAIRQADEQLYRAKANGRQQVCTEDLCLQLITS
jgi:diguanylate cyclase (GGDEF)-like protein